MGREGEASDIQGFACEKRRLHIASHYTGRSGSEMVDCFLEAKTKKRNTTKPTSVAGGTAISFASKMSWICNRWLRINWSNRTNTTVNAEPLVAPSRSGPEQLNKVGRLGDQLPPVATRA